MNNLFAFFGLHEDPFKLTPDPGFYFPSRIHQEALHSLEYIISNREGFCMVTGEPGTGKTTLVNVFREKWKDRADIALVLTPRLSPNDFLMALFDELRLNVDRKNKNELLKDLRELLIEKYFSGKYVVIIVDEAHNLPVETLEELRLLSNLETDKEKLVQIVFIGQPELENRLMQEQLRQLNQRITERIRLRPLTLEETHAYIQHRLNKAGRQNIRLNKRAVRSVYRFSRGIPRLVNLVLSRTIMAAYIDHDPNIRERHITYALRYLAGRRKQRMLTRKVVAVTTGAVFVMIAVVFGYKVSMHIQTGSYPKQDQPIPKETPLPQLLKNSPALGSVSAHESSSMTFHEQQEALFRNTLSATVKYNTVNIRSAPTREAPRIGLLYKGMNVALYECASDDAGKVWYKIFESDKGSGWVSEEVLSIGQLSR